MMLNLPIFGVVCEPKPSRVKKFEYFATENVNDRVHQAASADILQILLVTEPHALASAQRRQRVP